MYPPRDNKDMKIIEVIADNARLPYSKIGQLTRISKDRIRERIHRLKKDNYIISFAPLINYSAFGYYLFDVYIKFKSTITKEKLLVNLAKKHPRIVSLTRIPGRYDLEIEILAKNKTELKKNLKELNLSKFGKIEELCILYPKEIHFFSNNIVSISKSKMLGLNERSPPKIKIDSRDIEILSILSENSREKLVNMSYRLKMNVDALRHRINRLVKSKVIAGFYTRLNKHRFNLHNYILIVSTKTKPTPEQIRLLVNNRNICRAKSFSGKWNLVIDIYARNNWELIQTINYIQTSLENNLIKSELLVLLERYFSRQVPPNFTL